MNNYVFRNDHGFVGVLDAGNHWFAGCSCGWHVEGDKETIIVNVEGHGSEDGES